MEARHRRSVRETSHIGWTVSRPGAFELEAEPGQPSAENSALLGDDDDDSSDSTGSDGDDPLELEPEVSQPSEHSDLFDDADDSNGFWQLFDSNFEQIFDTRRSNWNPNVLFAHQNLVFFLVGLLLLLVFVVPPLLSALFFTSDAANVQQQQLFSLSSADRLRTFRRKLQQMLNQTNFANIVPRTKFGIERTLNYLAEQMLRRENGGAAIGSEDFGHSRPAPLVLLIASSTAAPVDGRAGEGFAVADSIATQYIKLLRRFWPEYRLVNVTAQPVLTKSALSDLLMRPLKLSDSTVDNASWWWWWWPSILNVKNWRACNSGVGAGGGGTVLLMLLNRIERLRGFAPLFLHSLADPESSPIVEAAGRHNVLIILTMASLPSSSSSLSSSSPAPLSQSAAENNNQQNDDDDHGDRNVVIAAQDCEALIASSLLSSWQSDAMAEDQIRPIVARISAIPLCVF